MKIALRMELIPGRTDPNAGAGSSVLCAEHGVQGVWQYLTGGGTVPQSNSKRFSLGLGDSKRSNKSVERETIVNMAPVLELEMLEMAPR